MKKAPSVAHRIAHDLLRLGENPGDTTADEITRVQSLREFLRTVCGDALSLQRLPSPMNRTPWIPASIPFYVGQILCQKTPPACELPAYTFPLPGQPVVFLGCPERMEVPDGARFNAETGRWAFEDLRVAANTPAGPVLLTVDSDDFEPWRADVPAPSDLLQDLDGLLDGVVVQLEKRATMEKIVAVEIKTPTDEGETP